MFCGHKWKCKLPVSFVEIFPYSCDQCHVSFRILDTLLRAYDRRSTPTNGLGMHNNLLIWGFLIHMKCYFFISREFISGYPTNVITQLYIASLGSINTENMVKFRFLIAWNDVFSLESFSVFDRKKTMIFTGLHNRHIFASKMDRPSTCFSWFKGVILNHNCVLLILKYGD